MPGPGPAPARVAVVTDSSASLPPASLPVVVVPLRVLAGGAVADDAAGPLPAAIAAELARGERLSTARPAPGRFAAAYAAAAAAGAPAVVSVHLSGELSGTLGSARLAAAAAPVPVHVVDSRTIGAGLGLVVAAAARAAAAGRPAEQVVQAARDQAARLGSFFALDSQDHLRAGGRLSGGSREPGRRPGLGRCHAALAAPADDHRRPRRDPGARPDQCRGPGPIGSTGLGSCRWPPLRTRRPAHRRIRPGPMTSDAASPRPSRPPGRSR